MTIVDLRPYEGQNIKPLKQLLDEHIHQVRGPALVIYNTVDKIIMTCAQAEGLVKKNKYHGIPVEIIG